VNQLQGKSDWEEQFRSDLARGLEVERKVGFDLFEAGCLVAWGNPPAKALDSEAFEPSRPDLVVLLPSGPIGLEIKGRSVDFSGPADFPYRLALVGRVQHWEIRQDSPSFVVIVSQGAMAGRIVIPCRTKRRWQRVIRRGEASWGAPRSCWQTWCWLLARLKHPTV
jgi:hypothetical protein